LSTNPDSAGEHARIRDDLRQLLRELKAIVFDFDGVLTDNTVLVDQNGIESVRCWRSDGLGLTRVRSHGVKTLIISTEMNPVVGVRARKLGTECIQGVDDKASAIREWGKSAGVALSNVGFVGHDIHDLAAFKEVGLPIGVADSYDEIDPYIKYRTRARGGRGAVREICDLIVEARAGSGRE
jgi:3-deoxy-D-manno-octulosonate 8-phosphate phosphatase (KDO 8-P phosphatase)